MNRNKKILFGLLILPVFLVLFYYTGWSLAPGSYARVEIYEFDIPEETLIKIIMDFKTENPSLDLTKSIQTDISRGFYLEDGRRDSSDYWYSIYFFYSDKNQIVHTWTRPKTRNSKSFAFVGVNEGLTLGNWPDANESFFWWKNSSLKNEFERRILEGIKEKINIK